MKSQDQASRSRRPYGRTRRSHAPKRVAWLHYTAAKLRQKPQFCGNVDDSDYQISCTTLSGTSRPSAPINTPCSATYRASRDVLGFLLAIFFKFLPVCISRSCTLWRRRSFCNWRLFCNKGHFLLSFNFQLFYFISVISLVWVLIIDLLICFLSFFL